MTTPCPLYYNAADVLAAFSRDEEAEGPFTPPFARPERRTMSAARTIASAWARSAAMRLRKLRACVGPSWRQPEQLPRPVVMFVAPESDRLLLDRISSARSLAPYRPALSSHFALIAPD